MAGGWPDGARGALARALLRATSLLVPRAERPAWLREWQGEVWALLDRPSPSTSRLLLFVAGALPHAAQARLSGWHPGGLWQDLRFAARGLRRHPAFSAAVLVTLAVGIGINGAMFNTFYGILSRPPAGLDQPERLVQVGRASDRGHVFDNWSYPALELFRQQAGVFGDVAGWARGRAVLGRGVGAEVIPLHLVTGSYFRTLGVRPAAGRLLAPDDGAEPGSRAVVVLSHALWTDRFGGDRSVVGRDVVLNGRPFRVVGVAPPAFRGTDVVSEAPRLWVPATMYGTIRGSDELPFGEPGWNWLWVVARLAPCVEVEEARAVARVLTSRLRDVHPASHEGMRMVVAEGVGTTPDDRRDARALGALLMGVVLVILLIAGANAANLFLARGTSRAREMGIRAALGSGRLRMARQLAAEGLLLGVGAALLALPVLALARNAVPHLLPFDFAADFGLDAPAAAATVAAGAAAGLLFGLPYALRHSRLEVNDALSGGGGSGVRPGSARLRRALMAGQLALSLALLTGGGLLTRSLLNARSADPGFRTEGVVIFPLNLDLLGYDPGEGLAFYDRLLEGLRGLPEVREATLAGSAPVAAVPSRRSARPAGSGDGASGAPVQVDYAVVEPGYFRTMDIRLVRGRAPRPASGAAEGPREVVVTRSLARRLWGPEDPLGRRLSSGPPGVRPWTVVGVTDDVALRSLRRPNRPALFLPISAAYTGSVVVHVVASGADARAGAAAARVVQELDPDLPVREPAPLAVRIGESLRDTRATARAVGLFGGLALVLAAVGLYGVVSFSLSTRTRELAVRIALGAGPGRIRALVLRDGVSLLAWGLAGGAVLALGTARLLEGLLYRVEPLDPTSLAAAAAILAATVLAASYGPARRAIRTDPVRSLREE